MKNDLIQLLQSTLTQLQAEGALPETVVPIHIEATKDSKFGDYASNIAMTLAKETKKNPREIANLITAAIPPSDFIQKVEIAGPGFINFFLSPLALTTVIEKIIGEKDHYGLCTIGRGKRILLEFLSSNPTGPLHVGHGRLAAYGSVVAKLLEAVGFKPYKEYYVNDAGRQMDILAVSVWIRYLNLCGETVPFPNNGYQGDYVSQIAQSIYDTLGDKFRRDAHHVIKDLPKDQREGGDKEIYIDAVIERTKALLGEDYLPLFAKACQAILSDIQTDLAEFGVHYDNWFSEREFVETGVVDVLLEKLESSGHTYKREGALWFRSTDFGDEKDRVLVRSNGTRTYFANDVAYHLNKFERGFDIAIDIFGSDHHGYTPRMKAAMEASGISPERLINLLIQFVTLYRGNEQVQMSTRSGRFITLRELREEVGKDAARFFYVMRKPEQHVDFDLELAKSESNENPLYYIQYAHARICSVFRGAEEKQLNYDETKGLEGVGLLTAPTEKALLATLSRFPDVIISAALNYEPHQLTNYLRELATDFHSFYNALPILSEENELRNARLVLLRAIQQTLRNGFNLLTITALERM